MTTIRRQADAPEWSYPPRRLLQHSLAKLNLLLVNFSGMLRLVTENITSGRAGLPGTPCLSWWGTTVVQMARKVRSGMGKSDPGSRKEVLRDMSTPPADNRAPNWRLVLAIIAVIWIAVVGLLIVFWPGALTNH